MRFTRFMILLCTFIAFESLIIMAVLMIFAQDIRPAVVIGSISLVLACIFSLARMAQ